MDKPAIGTVLVVTDELSNGHLAMDEVRDHQHFEVVIKNWDGKKFACVWPQSAISGRMWFSTEEWEMMALEPDDNATLKGVAARPG